MVWCGRKHDFLCLSTIWNVSFKVSVGEGSSGAEGFWIRSLVHRLLVGVRAVMSCLRLVGYVGHIERERTSLKLTMSPEMKWIGWSK
jgi:hypothetical protein